MNSAKFTWEKYCSNVGYTPWESWDASTDSPTSAYEELGRCLASSLYVRPRDIGEAVMLRHKESGDEFWMHVVKFYESIN